ncbi:MAG: 4-hydroxy-tetrahydrodipicolinate synthase [Planctomycetes bacterium]|nr:4-hydroxy-tetrahydrodipicolinate synthase [Planctomycetota bacterium]
MVLLSGANNFVLRRMEEGVDFDSALTQARAKGLSDIDSASKDATERTALLARLAFGVESILSLLESVRGLSPQNARIAYNKGFTHTANTPTDPSGNKGAAAVCAVDFTRCDPYHSLFLSRGKRIVFQGSMAALVTPFQDGAVDIKRLGEHVDFHLAHGTDALVPVGTTGESPTLTSQEKADIIRAVVRMAKGKRPVVAGTGTNDTRTTVEHTRAAKELGADAALLVTPYYNKPSQEGLYRHFEAVAKAVDLPLCLYNVPGRTGVNLLPETVARLSKIKNIAAIKEASGSVEQAAQIHALCGIAVVSGEDALTLPLLAQGATGVISVLANVVPKAVADLCAAARQGDWARAREIHRRHFPLAKALFIEPNPVPVKTAMKLMGRDTGEVRLPLCEMAPSNVDKLKAELKALGLI